MFRLGLVLSVFSRCLVTTTPAATQSLETRLDDHLSTCPGPYSNSDLCYRRLSKPESATAAKMEETFIMIKPEGVARGLIGEIITRLTRKGYLLTSIRLLTASMSLLESHYAEHRERPFFKSLVTHMNSGPVLAMVWKGKGVIKGARDMMGATNPLQSAPGTIRGDFGVDVGRNVIHGSDSAEAAKKEIALWFPEGTVQYEHPQHGQLYE